MPRISLQSFKKKKRKNGLCEQRTFSLDGNIILTYKKQLENSGM